jgi:hypothetical protein
MAGCLKDNVSKYQLKRNLHIDHSIALPSPTKSLIILLGIEIINDKSLVAA